MSTSYYSHAGIGIVLQEEDERFINLKQTLCIKYETENGPIDEDFLDDIDLEFNLEELFDDENVKYKRGGNFFSGDEFDHMIVCKGDTLQEQLDNIPKFLDDMNKYFPLTNDELNIVNIYQVM